MLSTQILSVGMQDTGSRLDIFIVTNMSQLSRSYVTNLIKNGSVLVCGCIKKPSYKVKTGEKIVVTISPPVEISLKPEQIDINIIFEDQDIIVINKQPGLVVHPASSNFSKTLANGILYLCPNIAGIGGELRPGIVHRLDKDTSGAILVAKNDNAMQRLSAQFKARSVEKKYLAIVHGNMEKTSGKIDFPIGRHPVHRKKMSFTSSRGKAKNDREAETLWKVKEEFDGFSFLELKIKTGRTHQIRVHCAAINHPVVGDPIYNFRKMKQKEEFLDVSRQMLHSKYISFIHPSKKTHISFEAELFCDMKDVLERLNAEF